MRVSPMVNLRFLIMPRLAVWVVLGLLVAQGPRAAAEESSQLARSAPAVDSCVVDSCGPAVAWPADSPLRHGWVSLDYLLWWTRGMSLPPLVTTSPAGTPLPEAGVVGEPGTTVLFGDEQVNDGPRSGFRFETGLWLDRAGCDALQFDFFALESKNASYQAYSDGDPILARPIVDATTGQPEAELIGFPGLVAGSVDVSGVSAGLWGWGLHHRQCLSCCQCCCGGQRWDWLIGYRDLRLDDRLGIVEQLSSPYFVPGTQLLVEDRFATRNAFHGLELGMEGERRRGPWVLEGFGRAAVGWNDASVRIKGQTTIVTPGFPTIVNQGGLLALDSNVGRYDDADLAAVFWVGSRVAYQASRRLYLRCGYDFLLWPSVYRAGDQIDMTVNPYLLPPPVTPLPGPLRPAPRLHQTNFWRKE